MTAFKTDLKRRQFAKRRAAHTKTVAKTQISRPVTIPGTETATELSLSQAKAFLGRLLKSARSGETVFIRRGHERFLVQYVPEIQPIPYRQLGYFDNVLTPKELAEESELARVSVIPDPEAL
jgi:hypothetical protein